MRYLTICLAALLTVSLAGCSPRLDDIHKTPSAAFASTGNTYLAGRVKALGDPGDGRSGFYLLPGGIESLAARLVLSEQSEKTIDAQYYLVHDDVAGHLFAIELLRAADRGLRVRLLIDDMDTSGYDAMSAALDDHPNIEIRLYNPFWRARGKALNALLDFNRINRRMHNKSMTFDNQFTIVGGRNIGAEYFEANDASNYDDLDILGAGPVARAVSTSFDAYWNSPHAVPVDVVLGARDAALTEAQARQKLARLAAEAAKTSYGAAIGHEFQSRMAKGGLDLDWVSWRLIADPPEKTGGNPDGAPIVASIVAPYLNAAERDLFVASAYFVPRASGTAALVAMERRGVEVSILTNSLDSTDVEPVYGHYARSRKDLLEAGVELWELRPQRDRRERSIFDLGKSQSGLHAKAFAIDRRYLFVGSVNWDPRSVNINTEMGILLDAPVLTDKVVRGYLRILPKSAYRLDLTDTDRITWEALQDDGSSILYRDEPRASGWSLFKARVFGLLPIGRQL